MGFVPARLSDPLFELVQVAAEGESPLLEVLDLVPSNRLAVGVVVEPLLEATDELAPIRLGKVILLLVGRFNCLPSAGVEVKVKVVVPSVGLNVSKVVVLPGECFARLAVAEDEVAATDVRLEVLGVGSHVGKDGPMEDVEVFPVEKRRSRDMLVLFEHVIKCGSVVGAVGVRVRRMWRRTAARQRATTWWASTAWASWIIGSAWTSRGISPMRRGNLGARAASTSAVFEVV